MSVVWVWLFCLMLMLCLCLVCFFYVGGSVSFFCSWSECLLLDIDLFVLQYLGCEDCFNEVLVICLEDFVDGVVFVLCDFVDVFLVLFGYSFGVVLVYEIVLCLESVGVLLCYLFVFVYLVLYW